MTAKVTPGKVKCRLFWDMRGVILIDFLRDQRTINAAYYSALLRDAIKPANCLKRRDIAIGSTLLLQDNAQPHVAQLTRDVLFELGWETLEHPPYSPDVSPPPVTIMSLVC